MAEVKFAEGMACMRNGEKAVTKSLFRWKPDWETGAAEFIKAATCFKNAKAHDQAKDAYVKAAEAQYNSDSVFSAAQSLENAAAMSKQMKRFEEAAELHEKASRYYLENGGPDKAAEALVRAAQTVIGVNNDKTAEYYMNACEVFETEGREQFAQETFKQTITFLIKDKKLIQAAQVVNRLQTILTKLDNKPGLWKQFLSFIVIKLAFGDYVAASKAYQDFLQVEGFVNTDESHAAHELLDAFEQGSQEAIDKATAKQTFSFLDNETAKLARSLKAINGLGSAEEESLT